MEAPEASHLRLERREANLHFASWRLSSSIVRSEASIALPFPAAPAQTADTDYVAAAHAALLNCVTQQPCGCYVFLEEPAGSPHLALYQLDVGEPGTAPQLHRVWGLSEAQPERLEAASLPASVAEVQTAPGGDAAAPPGRLLLVSQGRGDITLLRWTQASQQQPGGVGAASAPVFPLRPAPPLQGVRPVHLLACYQLPHASPPTVGRADLCCLLWAPRPRSQRHASRCEVFAVRLAASMEPDSPPALRVSTVQPLCASDLPPHGVLVNPATGGVLLALQPAAASAEQEAAGQRAAAAAAAQPPGGGGGDSDGDVSPRTLQAAVARLAAFTSEEPVGPLPHQQYADLYRESGADGIGAMGSEPACSLYAFELPQAAAADQPGVSCGAAGPADAVLRAAGTLSCQPHKLLACHLEQRGGGAQEPATPDTHLPQGGGGAGGGGAHRPRLLLGLTDDVDCAVVAVSCRAGVSGEVAGSAGGSFAIEHLCSVPALAYVAAGKVQRKFLLLAPPGGDVAAVLAEGQQYAYLYRSVAPRQQYGEHQVLDMELPDSGRHGLLGAVLAGSRAGACRCVLLAREGLRVVDM